jgi:hypothetical protein
VLSSGNLDVVWNGTPNEVLERCSLSSCFRHVDPLFSFKLDALFDALCHKASPKVSNSVDGV